MQELTSEQLLECIRIAYTLVNQGHVSLGVIQLFIQICFNHALSDSVEFSSPFRVCEVVSTL